MSINGIDTITQFARGQRVDAGRINNLDRVETFTPSLRGTLGIPDLGSTGLAEGAWHLQGHWVHGWVVFSFGGVGVDPGNGIYYWRPPFQPDTSLVQPSNTTGRGDIIGTGNIHDSDNTANNTLISLFAFNFDGNALGIAMQRPGSNTHITSTSPFTWAASDRITAKFAYPAKL